MAGVVGERTSEGVLERACQLPKGFSAGKEEMEEVVVCVRVGPKRGGLG